MGVLPLEFEKGSSWKTLDLEGTEVFDILGLGDDLGPGQTVKVIATGTDGSKTEFDAKVRIDTPVEVDYYRNGGILQTVLKRLAEE